MSKVMKSISLVTLCAALFGFSGCTTNCVEKVTVRKAISTYEKFVVSGIESSPDHNANQKEALYLGWEDFKARVNEGAESQ